MGKGFTPQETIEPHWTEKELLDVLNPSVDPIDSEQRIIRNKWQSAIESRVDGPDTLRRILNTVLDWKNSDPAVALWAGQVRKAQALKNSSDPYTSPEEVEAALIERIAQPAYIELEYGKSDLAEDISPIIESAAITQLRPDLWKHEVQSRDRVETVIKTAVDEYID